MDCTVTLVRKHRAWTAAVASVAGTVWSPLAGQPGMCFQGSYVPQELRGLQAAPARPGVTVLVFPWAVGSSGEDWVG